MKHKALGVLVSLILVLVTIVQTNASTPERSYLVLAKGNRIQPQLEQQITAAGGSIRRVVPEVGVLVVSSNNPEFQATLSRANTVQSVIYNMKFQMLPPMHRVPASDVGNPPNSGSGDFLFDLQWGHTAVDAPAAWATGVRGAGVRVAVLDTGYDLTHPDLVPNINFDLSRNFVEGETLQYQLPDPFSHGTHVAGTIAAAQNDFGVIGIAPQAELVLIKVLSDGGSGWFSDIIAGIVYAANINANIINMSLGAEIPQRGVCDEGGCISAAEVAELKTVIARATTSAFQRGTTVIAAAGNSSNDLNHSADLLVLPAGAPNVIAVSATGPQGWGVNPAANLDVPAFYTNYGTSLIDFAAPGGNVDWDLFDSEELCTVGIAVAPCWAFDLVFSTGNGGWYWSAGTSMASPHAAGVAALIISKNGRSMHPAQVEAALRHSADDLGKPGKDNYYGMGRVNALRAVTR
jgi:lantibiotic leader peptide-processing serine protease